MSVNQRSNFVAQNSIRFLLNNEPVVVSDVDTTHTLLTFLRYRMRLVGSKEGCAEGDCGACTVVVGKLVNGQLFLDTVNACIQILPTLDGKAVFTVEHLRNADGDLHPVQQAMVDCHGSQCGFCTPGFIMSLWQLYNTHQVKHTRADERELRRALSGNLCRCTGYRPILEAGLKMYDLPPVPFDYAGLTKELQGMQRDQSLTYQYQDNVFHAPQQLDELLQLRYEYPQATILAGCTDIGLWVNKQFRELGDIISVGHVDELKLIRKQETHFHIGAGVSLTDAFDSLIEIYPAATEMYERFASVPIRNAGTLGGNIANGSPIGDSMPWLIAVGARVVLRNTQCERTLLLEDYYLDYMKTVLMDDELLVAIEVPLPSAAQVFRTYKLAKRYDSDISAVCAGFSLLLNDDRICDAVIAFGGMAAIPKRAQACEQSLIGNVWNEETVRNAQNALANDYQPLSDMRASWKNRQQLAQNVLYRFFLETRLENPLTPAELSVFAVNEQRNTSLS